MSIGLDSFIGTINPLWSTILILPVICNPHVVWLSYKYLANISQDSSLSILFVKSKWNNFLLARNDFAKILVYSQLGLSFAPNELKETSNSNNFDFSNEIAIGLNEKAVKLFHCNSNISNVSDSSIYDEIDFAVMISFKLFLLIFKCFNVGR